MILICYSNVCSFVFFSGAGVRAGVVVGGGMG